MSGLDTGVAEYSHLSGRVKEYLLEGVVPSTIQNPHSGHTEFPGTVTVLNAACQLYLDNLPELIGRIEEQDPNSVKHQTRWTERLEHWTLKALDDLELISARAGT